MAWRSLSIGFSVVLICGCGSTSWTAGNKTPETVEIAAGSKQKGISWVAGREVSADHFSPVVVMGANWMVQTPFGWQADINTPQIRMATHGVLWGETDDGLTETTCLAMDHGIRILLKPHIWLTRAREGKWRTDIEMDDEEDWQKWWKDYRTFVLHYASLADQLGIDALCLGTELHATAVKREADWRALIAEVRSIYGGKLTYAANWYREFEEIRFWDALDWIGIQAYFPLSGVADPALDDLKKGWLAHLNAIEKVSRHYRKPVIFTEIGYRGDTDAAIEPWRWPKRSMDLATEADLQTQVRCYQAFFETFWDRPWFAGAYFWKWHPLPAGAVPPARKTFTPQGKPAGDILRTWFRR